jgi:hypothetical protein
MSVTGNRSDGVVERPWHTRSGGRMSEEATRGLEPEETLETGTR